MIGAQVFTGIALAVPTPRFDDHAVRQLYAALLAAGDAIRLELEGRQPGKVDARG